MATFLSPLSSLRNCATKNIDTNFPSFHWWTGLHICGVLLDLTKSRLLSIDIEPTTRQFPTISNCELYDLWSCPQENYIRFEKFLVLQLLYFFWSKLKSHDKTSRHCLDTNPVGRLGVHISFHLVF